MKPLLRGASQLLAVIAGLSFFVGGRVISAVSRTEWALAEVEGIGVAFLCGLLAFVAKSVADNFDQDNNRNE